MEKLKSSSETGVETQSAAADTADEWDRLTDVEWRLVRLTASGWNDRKIARATGKTQKRVKEQFQALLDKLGLADRLTLILASFANVPRLRSQILRRRLRGSNNGGQVHAERNG